MRITGRTSTSNSSASDVYRQRNLDYMKRKYDNLSAPLKQGYIDRVMQNKRLKNVTSKKLSSNVTWLMKGQMIPYEAASTILYDPVCSELHELQALANCSHCGAERLQYELPTFCCDNGRIKLAPIEIPNELYDLFTSDSDESVAFRKNIRLFNSIFSFTSFGVKLDKDLASNRHRVYTFRAQGMVYHDLPGLIPNGNSPGYFQLYFVETENEVDNRLKILENSNLSEITVKKLIHILEVNPYARIFRRLEDYPTLEEVRLHIANDVKLDQRVYSTPTAEQVAAIWIEGNNATIPFERDIIVHAHSGRRHRIKHYFGCCDPLQYPLLFPRGETGWHQNIKKILAKKGTVPCELRNSSCSTTIISGTNVEQPQVLEMDDAAPILKGEDLICFKIEKNDCWQSYYEHSPNNASCNKCNEDIEAPMPRYRLVISVVNGDDRAVVTLFEDAAATFVGCEIMEYITSLEKGEQNSKYFAALSSQVSKECRFLIFLNSKAQLRNEKLVVVAKGVELIAPVMLGKKEGASTMNREVQPKSVEKSLQEGAVETSNNGCPKDKPQGKHGSTLKLKNPGTKKRKGANISVQVSSDDEEPLKNLKQKCTKKTENGIRKKRSTAIKIKREKD